MAIGKPADCQLKIPEKLLNEMHHDIKGILDIYYQSFYGSFNNLRRLETHCTFKYNFRFGNYLENM